jgi:16S rRNA (cytidine1402-2'-O)-methyltransferase
MTKEKTNGTLYLVPTPIGNLKDMTFRAVETLKSVDMIYAEDTRTSYILLKHYEITTPLKSYHKFNEQKRRGEIIYQLHQGKNIAIISDAGTPGISDPSNLTVEKAIAKDINVCALPGATAFVTALVASGFTTETFTMVGFLPKKKGDRESRLLELKTAEGLLIFYESPHKLKDFLNELNHIFSKLHESYYRGYIEDICADIDNITLKGEFVIILKPPRQAINVRNVVLDLYYECFKEKSKSEASRTIAWLLKLPKNVVYEILLNEPLVLDGDRDAPILMALRNLEEYDEH